MLGGFQLPENPEVIQILADTVVNCPHLPVSDIQVPRLGTCPCSCPWQGAQSALTLPVPSQSSSCSNQRPSSRANTRGYCTEKSGAGAPSQGCRGQSPAAQAPPAATLCCLGGCLELLPLLSWGRTGSRATLLQPQLPMPSCDTQGSCPCQ